MLPFDVTYETVTVQSVTDKLIFWYGIVCTSVYVLDRPEVGNLSHAGPV